MYKAGEFVAEHISDVSSYQIQPNGVDLTVGSIYEQTEPGFLGAQEKSIGERTVVAEGDDPIQLTPGEYIIQYNEVIEIPSGHVGFVYPRSSLMRNSCMIDTAVWDAGYKGRGEGLLTVNRDLHMESNARIAQIVFSEAQHESKYDGEYQNENI